MQTPNPNPPRRFAPAAILADSQLFQSYRRAFAAATGLRPELLNPDSSGLEDWPADRANPACARLGLGGRSCEVCRLFNQELADAAQRIPQTRECPAGLWETVVPVRHGHRVIALLQVGPVRLRAPRNEDVERVMQLTWPAADGISAGQVKDAFWQVRGMPAAQYAASVQLLEVFALQLAEWFARHAPMDRPPEPPAVLRAREWIETHYHEPISLADLAKAAQISRWRISRRFHFFTGTPFHVFLARTRVTRAMRLLADPQSRVAEVAFAVGFRSLSQFNRTFRKMTGRTAGEFRAAAADGRDTTGCARPVEHQIKPSQKIVRIRGGVDSGETVETDRGGDDRFLAKPFSGAQLLEAVNETLRA